MVQQVIPSALRLAYEAAARDAGDNRAALCAAKLALLRGLKAAGVTVDVKDLQEFYHWVATKQETRVLV